MPGRAERTTSYRFLARWSLISSVAAVLGTAVVQGFRWALHSTSLLLGQLQMHPVLVAAAAALLVGGLVYRVSPNAAGEGIPSYLYYLNRRSAAFPLGSTVMKLPAAFLTIIGGGAGGLIGPLGRSTAGLMAFLTGRVLTGREHDEQLRTAAICGMSAAVASVFHAPLAAGFFAVEIIQRANMRYRDLFPSLLSAAAAVGLARAFGLAPVISVSEAYPAADLRAVPVGLLFAVVVAFLSALYTRGYALAVDVFRRDRGRVVLKVLIGMVAAVGLTSIVNPATGGTAAGLTAELLSGTVPVTGYESIPGPSLFWIPLFYLVVRALASFLTVGSGMSAGLAAPAIQLGALLAVATATVISPFVAFDPLPVLTVIGVSGMLAGSMNVPLAASVLAVELFGPAYGMAGAVASVIAFQINRSTTLYDHALAGSGHIDDETGKRDPGARPKEGSP